MPSAYFILCEYIIALIFQIYAFVIFVYLLFKRFSNKNITKLSLPFYMYMSCLVLLSFCASTQLIYLITFWNPTTVTYNSYTLFISGSFTLFLLIANATCVNFLSIDRILTLKFPIKYNHKCKTIAAYFIGSLFVCYSILLFTRDMLPDFPIEPTTNCRAFGCMAPTTQLVMYIGTRYFLAMFNLINGVIFVCCLKLYVKKSNLKSKTNVLLIVTLICTLFFDFIPHCSDFIASMFFNIDFSQVFGPYSLFVGSIDVGVCAFMYFKTLRKTSFNRNIVISSYRLSNIQTW